MAGQGSGGSRANGGTRTVSPAVYRRRRLVVAVLALLVIAGLVAGGIALTRMLTGGPAEADGTTAAPAQSGPSSESGEGDEAATASASPSPSAQTGCDEAQVVVESATDESVYPAGKNPVLTLTVTNKGDKPCEVNVGTSQMEFLVTSGDDRVFSSRDCQAESADLMQKIGPGKTEKANFTWERNRTSPGCKPVETSPKPGYYVLVTKLGERVSDKTTFELQ